MEASELDEGMKVLDECLARLNWRLKASSKRRLQLDILALSTGMRAVVMIDYGGIMPELQHCLSSLLQLAQNQSPFFQHLRLLILHDMIYFVHLAHLPLFLSSPQQPLLFVDLQQQPPKMITRIEESQLAMQLRSIQSFFSAVFSPQNPNSSDHPRSSSPSLSDLCIDLSNCLDNTDVTIPTLNGWLLGYPVVYLFDKDHISDAIYNLSTKYLHIFQVFVCRNSTLKKGTQAEELLSFSVPYDLSMRGSKEQWAEDFMAHMQAQWEKCANAWKSLKMEVSECHPQAIVL